MKIIPKLLIFFCVFAFLFTGEALAQSPEAFKYQAVVRNPDNTPVIEQAVGVRISILQGLDYVVYQESHTPTTSAIGLISLNVGQGNPLVGAFADIAWGSRDHFLQVEADLYGTGYELLGSSQLLSVPYALFAREAGEVNLTAGDGINIEDGEISNTAPSRWQERNDLVFVAAPKQVGIGLGDTVSLPADNALFVNGNIRLDGDAGLLGVNQITGTDALRFAGTPERTDDVIISEQGRVIFAEEVGINRVLSFVDLNVRNQAGNGTVFQVEDSTGVDLFEVGRNGNVGINQITNNVTLQVQNKSVGDNNIIANFEKQDGGNVLQVQADNDVVITGDFFVNSGSKNFILDHPLDPANKTLAHNAVESPDHVTYYDGTVRLGENGEAVVQLPRYFEALNTDYHYQLTCVGAFARVYIKTEISNNRFTIAGGQAGMKVSWQVSARRDDPWAHDHPYQAEEVKDPVDRGKYYYPAGYGKGKAFQIGMEAPKEND